MQITHALLGEHAILYKLLDHLEASLAGWELADCQAWGKLLERALASHAEIENRLLFNALEPALGTTGGPLAVMRMEHEIIEGAIGRLPAATSADEARGLLREIAGTARAHFAKEERVLFPMAAQVLGGAELDSLGARWSGERIPAGVGCH